MEGGSPQAAYPFLSFSLPYVVLTFVAERSLPALNLAPSNSADLALDSFNSSPPFKLQASEAELLKLFR